MGRDTDQVTPLGAEIQVTYQNQVAVPGAIRSRQHLAAQGARFVPAGGVEPTSLPITPDGVTYNMAQEAAWIDSDHFAVGRWDGSLSIFAFNDSPTLGPIITKAATTPAFEGVQMIAWCARGVLATSNDDNSVVMWRSQSAKWTDLAVVATLKYDPAWGVANSGDSVKLGSRLYLVIGHANGFVSIWQGPADGIGLELIKGVDVRNSHPTNPWGLHNIRGVVPAIWNDKNAYVVSGSEDGYLSVLRLPDGKILSQTIFNPEAQRGINSVAAYGANLLVANCAVGASDKNLWYYWIDPHDWSIKLRDSANLQVNLSAPQVFNFCAIWAFFEQRPCFFSSTEEGALWMGTVNSDRHLSIIGYQPIHDNLGSALAFNANGDLVVVNYNLYEFKMPTGHSVDAGDNPERLPLSLWRSLT